MSLLRIEHKLIIGPWRFNPRLMIIVHGPTSDAIDVSKVVRAGEPGDKIIDLIESCARRPGVKDIELGAFVRMLREVFVWQ